jgi:hypothetical protein
MKFDPKIKLYSCSSTHYTVLLLELTDCNSYAPLKKKYSRKVIDRHSTIMPLLSTQLLVLPLPDAHHHHTLL